MSGYIIAPPPAFNMNGKNVAERFLEFKTKFHLFMQANGFDSKEENQKVAILKSLCGDDLVHHIDAKLVPNETYEQIFQRLEEHFIPSTNVLQNQFKLLTRRQNYPAENFDKYLIELKKVAKVCNLGHLEDDLLKLVLILNVKDFVQQQEFLKIANDKSLDELVPNFRRYAETLENANRKNENEPSKNQPPPQQQKSAKKEKHESSKKPFSPQVNNNRNSSKKQPSAQIVNPPIVNSKNSGPNNSAPAKKKNNNKKSSNTIPASAMSSINALEERVKNLGTS